MLADEAFDDGVAGPVQLSKEGRMVSAASWPTDRAEVITNCNENLTEHK